MPHYLLFPRDISLLSLVFQCYMDYNNIFFFSHHTPHLHALWIVPSAQCHFACSKLTNKQTNKPLQKMSESEMEEITNSLETAALADGIKEESENGDPPRASTSTQRDPMSRPQPGIHSPYRPKPRPYTHPRSRPLNTPKPHSTTWT